MPFTPSKQEVMSLADVIYFDQEGIDADLIMKSTNGSSRASTCSPCSFYSKEEYKHVNNSHRATISNEVSEFSKLTSALNSPLPSSSLLFPFDPTSVIVVNMTNHINADQESTEDEPPLVKQTGLSECTKPVQYYNMLYDQGGHRDPSAALSA